MTDQATGSSVPATTSEPAAAAAAAPAAAAVASKAFYEDFSDKALAATPSVQLFKSPEELAKGFVNLEKRFGIDPARRIDLPADPADAEGMRAVYAKLGLPEKPDGYTAKLPEGASEADKAAFGKFIENAHKAGMPDAFVSTALEFWAGQTTEAKAAQETAWTTRVSEGKAALTTEWGAAETERRKGIETVLERYGDEQLRETLKGDGLNAYPGLAKMLGKMVERMAEPGEAGGRTGEHAAAGGPALTPIQARGELAKLQGDPVKGKALLEADHPQHKAVVEERNRLLRLADGVAA